MKSYDSDETYLPELLHSAIFSQGLVVVFFDGGKSSSSACFALHTLNIQFVFVLEP